MKLTKILYVDDEQHISTMVAEYLEAKNISITLIHDGMDGIEAFKKSDFDLCLLDIKMPFKDGYSVAEDIRAINEGTPFIFLTGQNQKEDKIKGLMLGADDYITKPFSMEELYLRIQNILKRMNFQQTNRQVFAIYEIGHFLFDSETRILKYQDTETKLTAIENELLKMFCQSENRVIDRSIALKKIWNDDAMLHGRSLNVYVSKIRSYLKSDTRIEVLNVHGLGYKLVLPQ
ncbi:MAG: response regulator transcription factor [Saprospiraceae bacterium]